MREIRAELTVKDGVDPVQTEYAVAMALFEAGIPIDPLTQKLQHGTLTLSGTNNKRIYEWTGEDRRQ